MRKIILIITVLTGTVICSIAQNYSEVTYEKYLTEVTFINDTIASQLENIIFKNNPEFTKRLGNYKYISVSRIRPRGYFVKKENEIHYVIRDTIKPNLQQYKLAMSNYKYLDFSPIGYFYMNGYYFFIHDEMPNFVKHSELKKLFSETLKVISGWKIINEDDEPSVVVQYENNSIEDVVYFVGDIAALNLKVIN